MEWIADRWEATARDLRWALLAIAAGAPIAVTVVILATTPGTQPPSRPFVSPDTTATQSASPIVEPAPTASAPSPDLADTGSAPAQFSSCAAARAAGVSQIPQNSAGYRPGLDPDGDGIACETDPVPVLLPTVVPFTAQPSPSPTPSAAPSATQSAEPTTTDPPLTNVPPTTVSEPPGPTSTPVTLP